MAAQRTVDGFLRYRAWILVGLTVLLVSAVRVRLREMPLERDEGEYAYAGQLILHGVSPYKEAYNMKLPGTYAAYALIMAVFGQSAAGIHFGLMLVNAASIVIVFLLGRKLLDDVAALAAAVSFALLSLSPATLGLAAHSSHFVTFFALAGTLVLVASVRGQGSSVRGQVSGGGGRRSEVRGQTLNSQLFNPQLFLSGILFGLGFVMDQHGVFLMAFGGVYLVFQSLPGSSRLRRSHSPTLPLSGTPQLLAFAAGCLVPYALTCLILWLAGVFPRFVFWTMAYASKYAGANPLAMAPEMLQQALRYVLGMDALLWLLPWAGAVVMWWMEWESEEGRMETEEGRGQTGIMEEVRGQRSEVRGQTRTMKAEHRTSNFEHRTLNKGAEAPSPPREERGGERRPFARTDEDEHRTLEADDRSPFLSSLSALLSPIPHPRFFLAALLVGSIGAVSVGYYFRSHYFIMALPALALLSGVAVSRGWHLVKHDRSIELFLAVPILGLFLIGIGASLVGNGEIWFRMSPAAAVREIYGTTLFSEAMEVANYVQSRVQSSESGLRTPKIAVIGSEPEIYFYCHARSATGYLYTYPLMEPQPYASKMQEEMISEIETNKPRYVIYVNDPHSWLRRPDSEKRIDEWWENYWTQNLDLLKTIEIHGRVGAPESAERKEILILKRRDGMNR